MVLFLIFSSIFYLIFFSNKQVRDENVCFIISCLLKSKVGTWCLPKIVFFVINYHNNFAIEFFCLCNSLNLNSKTFKTKAKIYNIQYQLNFDLLIVSLLIKFCQPLLPTNLYENLILIKIPYFLQEPKYSIIQDQTEYFIQVEIKKRETEQEIALMKRFANNQQEFMLSEYNTILYYSRAMKTAGRSIIHFGKNAISFSKIKKNFFAFSTGFHFTFIK